MLVGGRAAEVSGRAAADLEVSRSRRILQVSQSLASGGGGGGGGVGGGGSSEVAGGVLCSGGASDGTAAAPAPAPAPIPGRRIRAPVSNYALCDYTDYTDGGSTGAGGQVVVLGDGNGHGDGHGDGDDKGEGDGSEEPRQPAYTEGQRETNRVIQLQLRKRFSQLSSGRAAVEANQVYSTAMFKKLKERREMEAANAQAQSQTQAQTQREGSAATATKTERGGAAATSSSSSLSPSSSKTSCSSSAALDEGNMSVEQRIAFAADIAGVGARKTNETRK